jgi:hypothetical protein
MDVSRLRSPCASWWCAVALVALAACDARTLPSEPSSVELADADVAEVGESSGVWEWQRVDLLEPRSRRALCDWANARQGGYGRTQRCGSSFLTTDRSAAECDTRMLALGRCGVVTANLEDCVNAGQADLCAAAASAACAALRECHPTPDGGADAGPE